MRSVWSISSGCLIKAERRIRADPWNLNRFEPAEGRRDLNRTEKFPLQVTLRHRPGVSGWIGELCV